MIFKKRKEKKTAHLHTHSLEKNDPNKYDNFQRNDKQESYCRKRKMEFDSNPGAEEKKKVK